MTILVGAAEDAARVVAATWWGRDVLLDNVTSYAAMIARRRGLRDGLVKGKLSAVIAVNLSKVCRMIIQMCAESGRRLLLDISYLNPRKHRRVACSAASSEGGGQARFSLRLKSCLNAAFQCIAHLNTQELRTKNRFGSLWR